MTYFPFDEQTCIIRVWSTNYLADRIKLIADVTTTISAGEFYYNSTEWDLLEGSQSTILVKTGYLSVWQHHGSLTLRRRSGYYFFQIIGPCLLISFLVTLTFCIPSDAGEKISFSVTVLLSFTVYQLLIAEIFPRSSENGAIPLLSMY